MPALPDRIAAFTSDGVVITREDPAIDAAHPNAVDLGETEIEMFFDDPAHAEILLDQRWQWLKGVGRVHEAVEVETSFGLGTTIALRPTLPNMRVIDEARGIDVVAKIRAYVSDYAAERHSVELLG